MGLCLLLLLPDSSKNSTFILKNSANNSVFNSVFDSGSSNSGSIHQIYDSTSPRLRTRPCDIRLVDECQVGTPIFRNLVECYLDYASIDMFKDLDMVM